MRVVHKYGCTSSAVQALHHGEEDLWLDDLARGYARWGSAAVQWKEVGWGRGWAGLGVGSLRARCSTEMRACRKYRYAGTSPVWEKLGVGDD